MCVWVLCVCSFYFITYQTTGSFRTERKKKKTGTSRTETVVDTVGCNTIKFRILQDTTEKNKSLLLTLTETLDSNKTLVTV